MMSLGFIHFILAAFVGIAAYVTLLLVLKVQNVIGMNLLIPNLFKKVEVGRTKKEIVQE